MDKERYAVQQELLAELLDIQRNSAPIVISIGWTDKDRVVHDGIMLKDAPPVVIEKLIQQGYSLSLCNNGLHVSKF